MFKQLLKPLEMFNLAEGEWKNSACQQAVAESFRQYVQVMQKVAYQTSQRASPIPPGNSPNANGTPNDGPNELEEKINKFGKFTNGFKRALKSYYNTTGITTVQGLVDVANTQTAAQHMTAMEIGFNSTAREGFTEFWQELTQPDLQKQTIDQTLRKALNDIDPSVCKKIEDKIAEKRLPIFDVHDLRDEIFDGEKMEGP